METMMDVAFTHTIPLDAHGMLWKGFWGYNPPSPKQMNYHAISVTGTFYKGMKWFSETLP